MPAARSGRFFVLTLSLSLSRKPVPTKPGVAG